MFTLKQKELIKSFKLWSFLKLLLNLYMTKLSRFLAKILVPDGSKDVPVGQPIAVMVIYDNPSSMDCLSVIFMIGRELLAS